MQQGVMAGSFRWGVLRWNKERQYLCWSSYVLEPALETLMDMLIAGWRFLQYEEVNSYSRLRSRCCLDDIIIYPLLKFISLV